MQKTSLYPIIAHAMGVLMPSRVDNYPNACLEALSLGVPVVGTYNSSLDEMIIDGKTGFLAQNSDPESLILAIDQLLSLAPDQRVQMRMEIDKFVQASLAEDRVGQLLKFYRKTIEQFHSSKKSGSTV